MTSARDRLKARAKTVGSASTTAESSAREPVTTEVREPVPAEPSPTPSRPSPPARSGTTRTKPIKMTVDVAPVEHRRLKLWCATAAAELELPEVAASEVARVLFTLLHEDAELAERVRAELVKSGGSRRGWA